MPNALQKTTDLFRRMLLRASARVPVKGVQARVYQTALDMCDFKTLDYLLDQENVNIRDDDRCHTITIVAAAHRWVSNGGENISYQGDECAQKWLKTPLSAPHADARFLISLLKKSLKAPLEKPSLEKRVLSNLQVMGSPHIPLDLSSNDLVLSEMKFSPEIILLAVIKSLSSYSNTVVRVCDRSTCDELLRRHFKKIDWMVDSEIEKKKLSLIECGAWKEIVEHVPEPYLLSLIRSHKELAQNPYFIRQVLRRDFSFKVWSIICENGVKLNDVRALDRSSNKENTKKVLECCEYLTAKMQKTRLIKSVEIPQMEPEEIQLPKKRKM